MFDIADFLHGPGVDAAVQSAAAPFTGPFYQTWGTDWSLPQALGVSGYTTFYGHASKQLGRAPYRNIQGFQPALSQTHDFTGDWNWEVVISNGGVPGVAGLNFGGKISSSTTVGDLGIFLQVAEDSIFTNPVDLDGFDLPLSAWVESSSYASGLAPGAYTRVRRPIPHIPQPGVDTVPTWSASAMPTLKLLYDAARTYASGDVVWYNGFIFKSLQGSNTGQLPNAAASAYWKPSVWLPTYYRVKFVVSNGATASNLTSFLPVVGFRPSRS